jgi:hypothetical protein
MSLSDSSSRHSQSLNHNVLPYRRAQHLYDPAGRDSLMVTPVQWADMPHIEAYVVHHLSKAAHNSATLKEQQRMKKGAKRTRTKASVTIVMADQLDLELAAARPPSPPPDPAASAAWHQDNGLAVPDHLTTAPSLPAQEARPSVKATPANLAGAPSPDPRPPPAPYTDIPMEDAENQTIGCLAPRNPWSYL